MVLSGGPQTATSVAILAQGVNIFAQVGSKSKKSSHPKTDRKNARKKVRQVGPGKFGRGGLGPFESFNPGVQTAHMDPLTSTSCRKGTLADICIYVE